MDARSSLLDVGFYSLSEAAMLTGIPAPAINRWVFGYTSKKDGEAIYHSPVWNSQIQAYDEKALGFLDLLEVRFVAAFKRYGISLQAIRMASSFAREYFNSSHPFACQAFRTDGKSIFAELIHEEGFSDERALIDLVKRQYAFKDVIGPSLYSGIEYDREGQALAWRPNDNRYVILDPRRAFGRPLDNRSGVPTETLYGAWLAEGDERLVARLYEVELKAVKAAIAFEQGLRDAVLH